MNTIRSALTKSCVHEFGVSLEAQVRRLEAAGYHESAIAQTCERLIKLVKRKPGHEQKQDREKKKIAVIPYVHRLSHGLKI